MEMPRAFSSFRRSVSTPVSAFTSEVLPWSMWPAVPTIIWFLRSFGSYDHLVPTIIWFLRSFGSYDHLVPTIIWFRRSLRAGHHMVRPSVGAILGAEQRELFDKALLVFETAQVQAESAVADAPDHGHRQLAERPLHPREQAARALGVGGAHPEARAGEGFHRLGAAADLAGAVFDADRERG